MGIKKTQKLQINISDDMATTLQTILTAQGKTVDGILNDGQSPQGYFNVQFEDALRRKLQRGEFPAELIAEIIAFATPIV